MHDIIAYIGSLYGCACRSEKMEPAPLLIACIFSIHKHKLPYCQLPEKIQKHIRRLLDPEYLLELGFDIDVTVYREIVKYLTHGDERAMEAFVRSPRFTTGNGRLAQILGGAKVSAPFLEHDVVFSEREQYIYYLFLNLCVFKLWQTTEHLHLGVDETGSFI